MSSLLVDRLAINGPTGSCRRTDPLLTSSHEVASLDDGCDGGHVRDSDVIQFCHQRLVNAKCRWKYLEEEKEVALARIDFHPRYVS